MALSAMGVADAAERRAQIVGISTVVTIETGILDLLDAFCAWGRWPGCGRRRCQTPCTRSVYLKESSVGHGISAATEDGEARLHGAKYLRIDPEISGVSVVVVGSFNPTIFHPAWLMANEVEPSVEGDLVKVDVVHNEIAKFTVDDTSYFVDQNRLQVQTNSAPWIAAADKASRIVAELLPHTPLRAFGLNRDVHFRLSSPRRRMLLGRTLAPIEPWGEFGDQIASQSPDEPGGLLSLTLRGSERLGDLSVTKNVKIEPSARIAHSDGIFMQANFHFTNSENRFSADFVSEKLLGQFQHRVNEAERIFDHIMGLG